MKKFFLFASAALVLASCSSEAEEAVIKPNETPEEEVLELTEIKLGAGAPTASAETRAIVDIAGAFDDTKVGIFGVNENGRATNNDWSEYEDPNIMNIATEHAVILFNEPATIADDGKVTFDNVSGSPEPKNKFYFPRTNNNNYGYTFLGYYPKVVNDSVTKSTDSIVVKGVFDGTQDIIAGKAPTATPVNNYVGYNAKYIREYRNDRTVNTEGLTYPKIDIKFTHLATKIIVKLQRTSNYIQEMCDVYAAWFDVKNQYKITFEKYTNDSVKYDLAFEGDTVAAYAIGGGVFDISKTYEDGDVVKYNGAYYQFNTQHTPGGWSDTQVIPMTPKAPETSPAETYPIFIEPDPKQNGLKATKKLYLVLNDDINDVKEVTITSPADGFKPGTAYTVTVTINGPEAITVTASIANWTTGDDITADI